MIFSHDDVAGYLKAELARRMADDSTYSLRAMARDLAISPAYLSQLIHRKKFLSPDRGVEIAARLGLDEKETRYLYLLIQRQGASDAKIRTVLTKQLHDLAHSYQELALDAEHFRAISDWYHVAILEMTYLDDFVFTVENVAERLGVSEMEAGAAIERLERLGLLARRDDGTYGKTEANLRFHTSRRNEAFGRFMRQMMDLARHAMDHHPLGERLMMTQTFCLGEDQIEEAREITREYMQRMAGLFDRAKRRKNTYQLCVQFFNLTDGLRKSAVIRDDSGEDEVE